MERKSGMPPVHPGEIIKEDILPSVGLSVTAAAKALGVSRQMFHDILAEREPADFAPSIGMQHQRPPVLSGANDSRG
jgi:addiction module HigA family antidote